MDRPVDWRAVLETSRPLPDFETALDKVGNGITLDEFKVIWRRDLSREERTLIWKRDKKLMESLVLFQGKRDGAVDRDGRRAALRDAFTHFVINSEKPVGTLDAPGPLTLARSYGHQLCISISDDRLPDEEEVELEELRRAGKAINYARYGRPDVVRTTVFEFDDEARDYEVVNAMWMAEMAALAYHPEELVRKQLTQWGYAPERFVWIDGDKRGTQGFVAANDRHVVVCFRGTERDSRRDILVDLKSVRRPEDGSGGSVHSGFQSALNEVWSKGPEPAVAGSPGATLPSALPGSVRGLYVCGHSLGAALAQLAAYRLEASGHPVTAVYAFGSPLVGDVRFTASYDCLLGNRTFSHINHNDLITQFPPGWLGFRRLGVNSTRKFKGELHELEQASPSQAGPCPAEPLPLDEVTMAEDRGVTLPGAQERLDKEYKPIDESLALTTAYLDPDRLELEPGPEGALARQLPVREGQGEDGVAGTPQPPPEVHFAYQDHTGFEDDPLNDHGIYEYVFKLGCVIVDERLGALGVPVGEKEALPSTAGGLISSSGAQPPGSR